MQHAVKYYSPLEPSGYGLAAIAYIEALRAQGVEVYWTPFLNTPTGYQPWPRVENARQCVEESVAICVPDPQRAKALIACLTPVDSYQVIVMHIVPEYWPTLIEPEGYHIGYTVWETTKLPVHFPDLINLLDKILVPSAFNAPIFKHSGVTIPIEVVPHILACLEPADHCDMSEPVPEIQVGNNRFVFYTINTWTARKAMWTLVHCYLQAFTGDDAVELVIKTSLSGPSDEHDHQLHDTEILLQNIIVQYRNAAHITIIKEHVESREIEALHRNGDCYISAAHSEGWGLGAFEAAAYGNPVIMTGWGGQLDFLAAGLSTHINYRLVKVIDARGHSYTDDQQWAEIDEMHMVDEMRKIYADSTKAKQRAKRLAHQIRQVYSSQIIGKKFANALFATI